MKLEEGMYIRNEDGYILNLTKENIYGYKSLIGSSDIKIKSHKIIDLIQVGDYVNGNKVIRIETSSYPEDKNVKIIVCCGDDDYYVYYNEDIKTILTKEQYENNCYRIEE